jgi:hypothetical protein
VCGTFTLHNLFESSNSNLTLFLYSQTTLTFYDRLVLLFCIPIAVFIALGLFPFLLLLIKQRFDYSDSVEARRQARVSRHKIIKLLVFAAFLMYPAISTSVLSFFICRTVVCLPFCVDGCCYHTLHTQLVLLSLVGALSLVFVLCVA